MNKYEVIIDGVPEHIFIDADSYVKTPTNMYNFRRGPSHATVAEFPADKVLGVILAREGAPKPA